MILDKEVIINITNRNKGYYNKLGYNCNTGDKIKVKIEDLYVGTQIKINVKCDNCGIHKLMSYEVYNRNLNSTPIHIYYCNKCNHIKNKILADYRQKNGELKREDSYYWAYSENREKEFFKYLSKYENNLNNMNDIDYSLYAAIDKYEGGIINYLLKLGLNPEDYFPIRFPTWNYTKEDIIDKIKTFIAMNNRFPSQKEINGQLKINGKHFYKYFRDINDCKREIGYYTKDDLIDNRGDLNRSMYELFVANFLIAQGFANKYKREQYPFRKFDKTLKYRSDFTLYIKNENPIHIEVWATSSNTTGEIFKNYMNVRKEKERLYTLYSDKITLISIEPEIFQCSYNQIGNRLYNIFKDYLNLPYQTIEYDNLLSVNSMTETEILERLLQISKDDNKLPSAKDIYQTQNGYSFLHMIECRFGGITYFSTKYEKEMSYRRNGYWNAERVYKCFDYMLEKYGHFVGYNESRKFNEYKFKGLYSYLDNHEGQVIAKLKFIQYKFENDKHLSDYLNDYLYKMSLNKLRYARVTPEQQELAKQLYDQINNRLAPSILAI